MKNKLLIVLLVIIGILIIGCDGLEKESVDKNKTIDDELETIEESIPDETPVVDPVEEEREETIDEKVTTDEKNKTDEIAIDYEKIRPNEAGRVMVIMYHSLGEKEAYYVSTPDILRQNLQDLYDRNYYLVSLKDFVNNSMDVPAGKTPVVLTFDDGHRSNFNVFEESGELIIDPESAVGIIDDFYEEHPDFGKAATFFLNSNISFSQVEQKEFKLNYLVDNGYDLGSHSYGHEDLTELDASGIQKTLGKNVQSIERILENYTVNLLALPFGRRPKEPSLEKYVFNGVYENQSYEFIAVLNVGWNPTYSPVHKNFNYKSINRVQSGSGEFQLSYWIDYYDENPDKKYISDGIKNQITVPKVLEEEINHSTIKDKELVIYERD